MKLETLKQTFKVTRETNAAAPEELRGKKRETVEYKINTYEPEDIPTIPAEQAALIVNTALENYAKGLFAENQFDWSYIPSAADVTVEALYNALTAERRTGKRTLTNVTLAAFAEVYAELAVSKLSKSVAGANSGAKIIRDKLSPILGNPVALSTFHDNLEAILILPEFDIETHGEVVQALLELIAAALDQEIAIDAL